MPASIQGLLAGCDRFRTLEEHEQECSRRLGLSGPARSEMAAVLAQLAAQGLLVSRRKAMEILEGSVDPSPPGRISAVGIPTADRPTLLRRALRSYVHNARDHGRTPLFIVVDDSRSRAAQVANRTCVSELRRQRHQVLYVGHSERARFARSLARRTGIDPRVLQFALLPGERHAVTTGAARNALLLLTMGRLSMQVDDDTVPETARPTNSETDNTLSLSSLPPPYITRFDSWEALRRLAEDTDVLAVHERLLGRSISQCVRDRTFTRLRADDIDGLFLRLAQSGARVRATVIGAIGDSGTTTSAYTLLRTADEYRASLLASDAVYRLATVARRSMRIVDSFTISHTPQCVSMGLGLDGTSALPPFLPVARSQESLFGVLLYLANGYLGMIPRAILHRPTEARAAPSVGRDVAPLSVANHVVRLIRTLSIIPGGDLASTLRASGTHLSAIGSYTDGLFEETVSRETRGEIARRLARTRTLLEGTPPSAPALYKTHLRQAAKALERALAAPMIPVHDLPAQVFPRPLSELRDLIGRLGDLLKCWPDVISAAAEYEPSQFGS